MNTYTIDKEQIYIIAGMPRTGTTFLYHNLQKHPNIFAPARKEVGYFAYNYEKSVDWYFDFYKDMKENQKGLDITGMYFFHQKSIPRILEFNSEAKIILGVREPKEWIFSLYEHYSSTFGDIPNIKKFLEGTTLTREGTEIEISFTNNAVSERIEQFKKQFSSNLLLYKFSLLKEDSLKLIKGIEKFLGIRGYFNKENYRDSKINPRKKTDGSSLIKSLQQNEFLVNLALKLLPRKLILRVRNLVDSKMAEQKSNSKSNKRLKTYSEEELRLVDHLFSTDSEYVQNLFNDSRLILGDDSEFISES